MKTNIFRGDMTDISAAKEALAVAPFGCCICLLSSCFLVTLWCLSFAPANVLLNIMGYVCMDIILLLFWLI